MEPTAGATPLSPPPQTYLEKHRTFPRTADRRNLSRVSRVYAGANQFLFFRLLLEHSRCGSAEQLRGKRNAALKSGLVDECWLWVTEGRLDMLCSLDYALRTRGSISSHRQYLLWCIWPRCGLTFWVALIGCPNMHRSLRLWLFTLHLAPWEVSANICKLVLPYKNQINHLYS